MSADWYFLKRSFFGNRRAIGPLNDVELREQIEKGVIKPETMVSSETKTRGHWCHMQEIPAALAFWKKSHPSKS